MTWRWSPPFARGSALTPVELNDNAVGSRRYPTFAQSSAPQYCKKYCLTQTGPSRIGLLCECGKGTPGGRPDSRYRATIVGVLRGIGSYRREPRQVWSWLMKILEWRKSLSAPNRRKNLLAAEVFSAGRDLIKCLIKEGRLQELRARAYGRAKRAALTGVFVAPTDPP
jgi:hypothetical protein